MGMYIYGIVLSVVMIAAGLSGQFSGGGSGINLPLVAVGALFLAIDAFMLLKARQAGQQAPQADNSRPTVVEVEPVEAAAEPLSSERQEVSIEAETIAEASAESMEPVAEPLDSEQR
ncbi:MAG: hypothetical protein IJI68_05630 [Eggerthellaceae bacterium]|nr:hypothetical protein [Eggerthellaceae bacterium]